MGKAGGMMGKIFVAAGNAAGVPMGDIVYGLSSSGNVAKSDMDKLSTDKQIALGATFSSFQKTLEGYATKTDYSKAFSVLGADSGLISQFNKTTDEYINLM